MQYQTQLRERQNALQNTLQALLSSKQLPKRGLSDI